MSKDRRPSPKTPPKLQAELQPESWLVAGGRDGRPGSPLNTPLVAASNFVLGEQRAYSRDDGTDTWQALEDIVGGLEGGTALAFASGMAAIAAVFDQLPKDAVVVLPDDCYQGVTGLAKAGEQAARWQLSILAVDDTDGWIDAANSADLLWLETPSNPLLAIADLVAICAAPRRGLLAVDNTFATPLNQRPLALGADISVQSATKYLGGHSDLLAGVATTNNPDIAERLQRSRVLAGATPGALEAFLTVRGLRTLALRLERAQQTAMELARRLQAHANVQQVRYPGLTSHPQHELAREQLDGFGTIISFDVRGDVAAADRVCLNSKLIQHATSLGAVESTIERRAAIPGQQHLPPTLLRLSVGIENLEDLWADLDQALMLRGQI